MLPIAAPKLPASAEQLAAAIVNAFAGRGVSPVAVRAEGANYPALENLTVTLTGAQVSRATRPPRLGEVAPGTITAKDFAIAADPLLVEGAPVRIDVRGADAEFTCAHDEAGGLVLKLARAREGGVELEVARADLDKLVLKAARDAASPHGVDIRDAKVTLTSRGPRALSFRAGITAKMLFMSTDITLGGDVDIDEQLNVRLSQLNLLGDGMTANLARGFLRPHFDKLEGRAISLLAFSAGALQLRDLEVQCGDALKVRARLA